MRRFIIKLSIALAIICFPAVAASAQEARSAEGARASIVEQLQREYRATGIYLLRFANWKDMADSLVALRECSAVETTNCYATPRKIVAVEMVEFLPADSAVANVFRFGNEHGVNRGFTITQVALRYTGDHWLQVGEIQPKHFQHPRTPH
ncbi:MAG: hypothetical protein V4558_02285 [Gemmatimonadota bacterium]